MIILFRGKRDNAREKHCHNGENFFHGIRWFFLNFRKFRKYLFEGNSESVKMW